MTIEETEATVRGWQTSKKEPLCAVLTELNSDGTGNFEKKNLHSVPMA